MFVSNRVEIAYYSCFGNQSPAIITQEKLYQLSCHSNEGVSDKLLTIVHRQSAVSQSNPQSTVAIISEGFIIIMIRLCSLPLLSLNILFWVNAIFLVNLHCPYLLNFKPGAL